MPTTPSKPSKSKKDLSPNHVSHVHAALRSAKSSHGFHPLLVPPAPDAGGGDNQMIPAKTGEYIIPSEVVARKGTQFFDNLIKKTLEEVIPSPAAGKSPSARLASQATPASSSDLAGSGTPETGYRWGGEVREPHGQFQMYNPNNQQQPAWASGPTPALNAPWSAVPAPLANNPWSGMPAPQVNNSPSGSPYRLSKDINYQQVVTPTEGGGPGNFAANPSLFYGDGFSPSGSGFPAIRGGFPHPAGIENRSFNTNPFWQNQPGMPWSPTMIPTTYNPEGYPRAVPVFPSSPDYDSSGPHPHTPPKSNS